MKFTYRVRMNNDQVNESMWISMKIYWLLVDIHVDIIAFMDIDVDTVCMKISCSVNIHGDIMYFMDIYVNIMASMNIHLDVRTLLDMEINVRFSING